MLLIMWTMVLLQATTAMCQTSPTDDTAATNLTAAEELFAQYYQDYLAEKASGGTPEPSTAAPTEASTAAPAPNPVSPTGVRERGAGDVTAADLALQDEFNAALLPAPEDPCKCVPSACCERDAIGTAPATEMGTDGAGQLDIRSRVPPSARQRCLRAGEVCCPPRRMLTSTSCATAERNSGFTNSSSESSRQCETRQISAGHGSVVSPGQFPWLVTVWKYDGERLVGAGAIVHPRIVITAAHIVEDEPADSLVVRLPDGSHGDLNVEEAVLHVDWGGRARYHDLAVLLLTSPIQLSSTVQPACFGAGSLDPEDPYGKLTGCQTVQIVDEDRASSLRASDVQLMSRDQCEGGLKNTGKLPSTFGLHYSFICAKTDFGSQSACRTESGAPMTCDDPARPGSTVLVGLLSWNAACRGLYSWPDVYTRLADVDNHCWLQRTMVRMLGEEQSPIAGDGLCK